MNDPFAFIPRRVRMLLFAVTTGAVAFVSLWPRSYVDEYVSPEVQSQDHFIHLGCFLAHGFCTLWAWGRRERPWRSRLAVFAGCALFGLALEVLQKLPAVGRSFQWGDVQQNTLGAALAAFLLPRLFWPAGRDM